MKTPSDKFKEANDKIFNVLSASIKNILKTDLPAIDIVMNKDAMSEADKIFFETYKLYGDRSQTWQEFRDMFKYSQNEPVSKTVARMQNTVKNWKTNQELTKHLYVFYKKLKIFRDFLKKYNVSGYIKNKNKYDRVYPDIAKAYQETVDAEQIALFKNYDVYNPKVAKVEQDFYTGLKNISSELSEQEKIEKKAQLLRQYIQQISSLLPLKNKQFVIAERVDVYKNIICNNPDIINMAIRFDSLNADEKIDFASKILSKTSDFFGLYFKGVNKDYTTENGGILLPDQIAGYEQQQEVFHFNVKKLSVKYEEPGYYDLGRFLNIIIHEDGHRIDYQHPEMGMCGEQIMRFAFENYMESDVDFENYFLQPTEQSSYSLGPLVGSCLAHIINYKSND